jgi:hypothetical protein
MAFVILIGCLKLRLLFLTEFLEMGRELGLSRSFEFTEEDANPIGAVRMGLGKRSTVDHGPMGHNGLRVVWNVQGTANRLGFL